MLLVALICLLLGALFLYLEIREYGGFGNVKGPLSLLPTPASTAVQSLWA
jgi:hypothetical protein